MAYVVTEKTVTGYSQRNSLNYPAAGQFYFLPPEVLPGMLNFHKVARGTETAFNGVESSLPSNIEGKTEYTFSHEFAIPATVEDPSNISVIAIILNKRTRQAFNAWEVETLSNYTTSLEDVKECISYDLNAYKYENSLIVSLPSEADANGTSVNVYNLQGMLLSTSTYLQENVIIINDININQPLVLQCIKDGKVLGSKKILF